MLKHVIKSGDSFLMVGKLPPLGVPYNRFGHQELHSAASTVNAKMSSMLKDGQWYWQPARSNDLVSIQVGSLHIRPGQSDPVRWLPSSNIFSCKSTWEAIQVKHQKEEWANLIWCKGKILKHAFVAWLATQDRLTTRERLLAWA